MQAFFDIAIERDPRVFAFGEDVGKIGDVNQGFAGLQEKFGESRVFDTGIRELTIIGQGIGAALRGLRPIAEIQYLDYLLYGLQPLSDDLATLQYRTKGGQKAPLIVRTRGHRLEGIWHSGSPIGMILNSIRGMHVLVPRNMVQAAGFYNTMLQSDEPALIIECLNGYRLKERLPDNLGEYTTPLGIPETLIEGEDVTIVSYGSTLRIAEEAIKQLQEFGISCELIDVQSLLPFDINHSIVESIKKTNKVIFIDEDVPGAATAYMMQHVLEDQEGYKYLDAKPLTITAKAHRPPYGTDGDYFTKPSAEDIFETIMNMMHEYNPSQFPKFL
jgi:pyruvate/2-oxoglutarate/acetoin dehydrogenase E1 component